MSSPKPGFIYIATNPAFPGFCKLGVTEDIKKRLSSYQTGDPKRNFKIIYYVYHPDCYNAERKIQENFRYFALSRRNEWFEVDPQVAIVRLQEMVECQD